jgi:hypothetical protein
MIGRSGGGRVGQITGACVCAAATPPPQTKTATAVAARQVTADGIPDTSLRHIFVLPC